MKLMFLRSVFLGSAAAASFALLPNAAVAQPFPDQTITGVVQQWTSAELLTLKDDRGYIDTVSIGQQTEVSGGRDALAPGARVSIRGYNGGQWFDAAHIDVLAAAPQQPQSPSLPSYAHVSANPYPYAIAYPYPVAYAVPYAYPYGIGYPYYGYPYYGYGVRLNLGFVVGGHHGYGRGYGHR